MTPIIQRLAAVANDSLWGTALDVVLKSTVLLILATLTAVLLRRSSAAVRHRLWCLTFAGLIVLPALSYALPAWQIPVLPAAEATLPPTVVAEPVAVEPLPSVQPMNIDFDSATDPRFNDPALLTADGMPFLPADFQEFEPLPLLSAGSPGDVPAVQPVETPPLAAGVVATRGTIAIAWLIGATLVLVPLLAGLLHSAIVGVRAERITDASWTALLHDLCGRLELTRRVTLLELRQPVIPMTWGVMRPVVVVPQSAQAWPERLRRFVLLHELAHVKRWDVPLQLLGRVACALYWFHPLAWYALRQLRIEREHACDDCVVTTGERPSDYAEQLLQIVRTCRPAGLASVGVAMARTSHLEGRIRAMFDKARSHVPLTARAARTLSLAAAFLVTAVAVVRPAAREVDPVGESETANLNHAYETEAAVTTESVAAADGQPSRSGTAGENDETFLARGAVVDPAGKPASGATVEVVRVEWSRWAAAPGTATVLSSVKASAAGEFEVQAPAPEPAQPGTFRPATGVVATAPGYGFACRWSGDTAETISLAPPQAIRGRVLDLEGAPIQGVSIRLLNVVTAKSSGDVDEWINAARAAPVTDLDGPDSATPPESDKTRFPIDRICHFAAGLFPQLETDADGRFELDGIGRDRVAVLLVSGPGLVQSVVQVLARPLDEPLQALPVAVYGGTNVFHGADFTFVAGTTAPVFGVVRDLDSHEPIAGAHVMVSSLAGIRLRHDGYIVATTDADGRYELNGLPPGHGNRLKVVFDEQPYLITEHIELPELNGLNAVLHDIELPKAVWATGRLFDESTGAPVQGWLFYSPFHGNEFALRYPQYADATTHLLGNDRDYHTDAEGWFRIPVIPGRGVLCAKAEDDEYRTAYGVDTIAELVPLLDRANVGLRPTIDHIMPETFHTLREINPPSASTEVHVSLPVDRGLSLDLVFTNPAGAPVTGVRVRGAKTSTPEAGAATESNRATVVGLTRGTAATVRFAQADGPLGARVDITPTGESGPLTIVLHPPVVVRGRLVDPQDKPLTKTEVVPGLASGNGEQFPAVTTDENGEFSVNLLVGETYMLGAVWRDVMRFAILAKDIVARPGEAIDLGDLIIDPKAGNGSPATPKRAPTITKTKLTTAVPTEPETVAAAPASSARSRTPKTATLHGTVVGPDSQPVGDATIQILHIRRTPWHAAPAQASVVSSFAVPASGQFDFQLPDLPPTARTDGSEWMEAIATAPGRSFAVVGRAPSAEPLTVPLAAQQPIRGRIVDLEGAPIAGATIRVLDIALGASAGDVDQWLENARKSPPIAKPDQVVRWSPAVENTSFPAQLRAQFATDLFPTLVTDDDGRFVLDGIGRDRAAQLLLSGPGLAQSLFQVLARRLDQPVPALAMGYRGANVMYGADFTFVAGPSAPVRGVFRDLDTKAPIPGALVIVDSVAGSNMSHEGYIVTTTDAEGRYELNGLPLGKGNRLKVLPGDQPYLATAWIEVPESRDPQPIIRDIELPKAVWVTGRLFDETTGKPVRGTLHFSPFLDNQLSQRYPQYADQTTYMLGNDRNYQTDADGRFRIPVTPGRGVICAKADSDIYQQAYGAEQIAELVPFIKNANAGRGPTSDFVGPRLFHSLREINPAADAQEITVDLPVNPGISLEFAFTDPSGQPLTGVALNSLRSRVGRGVPGDTDRATAIGLTEGHAVTVDVRHRERHLGARVDITPTRDAGLQTIALYPPTIVRGRLIDPDGRPVTGSEIEIRCDAADGMGNSLPDKLAGDDGTFSVELIVGETYDLVARNEKYAVLAKDLAANPGEAIDLGDLVINPDGKTWDDATPKHSPIVTNVDITTADSTESAIPVATLQQPPATRAAMPARSRIMSQPFAGAPEAVKAVATKTVEPAAHSDVRHPVTIRGRVVNPDDQPVPGVSVAVVAERVLPADGATRHGEVLGQTTTNDQGEYEIGFSGVSSKTHRSPNVIAWTAGSAIAWTEANIDLPESRATLTLEREQPIDLRFVDLEGQPAAGVSLAITGVMVPGMSQPSEWLGLPETERMPRGLFGNLTSDDQGRVTIRNVAASRGVFLSVVPSDRFAPQVLALNTGNPEQRGPRDMTYRGGVRNVKPGETATIALAPAQIFEGRVMLGRGDRPAANARISMWSSEQDRVGSMMNIIGQTDAEGRFRLNPYPGVRFGIVASPPAGAPFHTRKLDDLRWSSGEASKSIEIRLPPGVLARGTVVDSATGEPLKNASVQYQPNRARNQNLSDDIVTGWQGLNLTNDAGEFQLTVLPGPGTLIVHGPGRDYVLKVMGQREIYSGDPGGARTYAHAFAKIDPAPGEELAPLKFELMRGTSVTGTLTDPDGQPIERALMISTLQYEPSVPFWRGRSEPLLDGTFEAHGLEPDVEYPLYFVDVRRKLGATARITAATPQPSVVLQPCGTAKARFVDQDGQPVAGQVIGLMFVATPGKPKLARLPDQGPEFLADEDHYGNCIQVQRDGEDPSLTDADGHATYEWLIPGATYRLYRRGARSLEVAAEFSVEPSESRDLGEIRLQIVK